MPLPRFIPRIFRHANARYGKPYVTAVRPVGYWNLPVGFSYNDDLDLVRNSSGTVLRNVQDYWVTDIVYIVPVRHSLADNVAILQETIVSGNVQTGTIDFWVLGASDIGRMLAAHSVMLGDRWYTVSNVQVEPSGYPTTNGIFARISLVGR